MVRIVEIFLKNLVIRVLFKREKGIGFFIFIK